ncbi:MAG: VTT domain-containing protein [Candidatus Aenigmarchaeota archaeon]|nr:VTT domain-containing protein [Candidatus Aenigmarchaeota archaeon]
MFGLEFLTSIVQNFGYLGFFLVGFLSSFTLFIPSPAFIVVFLSAPFFDPLLLGIAAGFGSAVGEMTGYIVGYGIEKLAERKKRKIKKDIMKIDKLFKRYHPDAVIFAFSALPLLPIDAIGIFCGAIGYSKKRFFFFVLIGKLIKFIALAYLGFYGVGVVLGWL